MKLFKLLTLIAAAIVPAVCFAQSIDSQDVITKHRNSIASRDAIAAVKNQLVLGDIQFTFKGSAQVISGKGLVLSAGDKVLWGMNFASNDYPQDRFAFDGKKANVGRATPTTRSLLGDFLFRHDELLKHGLLGGTLSSSWVLLNDANISRFSSGGRKTIDGKETVVLKYSPKGGSDLSIKMYFDAKNYQHVRTEHTFVRPPNQGPTVDTSAGQSGEIMELTEDFSNFKKLGDLTLPSTYKITFSRTGTAAGAAPHRTNRDAEWTFVVTDYGINRELDENSFKLVD